MSFSLGERASVQANDYVRAVIIFGQLASEQARCHSSGASSSFIQQQQQQQWSTQVKCSQVKRTQVKVVEKKEQNKCFESTFFVLRAYRMKLSVARSLSLICQLATAKYRFHSYLLAHSHTGEAPTHYNEHASGRANRMVGECARLLRRSSSLCCCCCCCCCAIKVAEKRKLEAFACRELKKEREKTSASRV